MTLENYKAKLNNLKPYTSHQEKSALIKNIGNDASLIDIARELGTDPKSEIEAHAFIFKVREISVSDIADLTHVCPECNYQNIINISIPSMFFQGDHEGYHDIDIGLFDDIDELEGDIINTISIDKYNSLYSLLKENNKKIFNPEFTMTCVKCKHSVTRELNPGSIVSKFSIANVYEQYLDISSYTSMTKADTDSMIPFEREIFMGLIQKKEDEKK